MRRVLDMCRWVAFLTTAVVCSGPWGDLSASSKCPSGQVTQHGVRPLSPQAGCRDENGDEYSSGSLRKVNDQVQKCQGAEWVLDISHTTVPASPTPGQSCRSDLTADKAQEYQSGLFRVIGNAKKVEQCRDGKWFEVSAGPKGGRRRSA